MILWCDGAHAPDENMRRDAALLAGLEASESRADAVLRLFRFAPYGITLGHSQKAEQVLDLDRCRADGVPWAVRPTGGRAIFHAEEWTYSLAAEIEDPLWGGSLSQAYERAASLVLRSLVRLGVPAALAARGVGARVGAAELDDGPRPAEIRPHGAGAEHGDERAREGAAASSPGRDPSRAACFASTARHEIVLGGRKLAGSAQRRGARALLQQGSVLLGPGHERLADYLKLPEAQRAAARAGLAMAAAHAGPALGPDPPLERWADALMAELSGARRLDGAAGAYLLTLAELASYTARP
jgi:lipoate-protein ligase A